MDTLVATILGQEQRQLSGMDVQRYKAALALVKSVASRRGVSNQRPTLGGIGQMVQHPFNMRDAINLKLYNEYHAACVKLKWKTLTGLGLKDRKFRRRLNQLCRHGFAKNFYGLMALVAQDLTETFNGYIEVVRQGIGGKIIGLHHVPSTAPKQIICDDDLIMYELDGGIVPSRQGESKEHLQIMCEFGQGLEASGRPEAQYVVASDGTASEIIHISFPSNLSRYYGVPDWLPVVASVELISAARQHLFDFFNNRGVPALLMFLSGGFVGPKLFKSISEKLQENVGGGNAFRSNVFHLPDELTKVQFQQLSPQNTENGTFYKDMQEALSGTVITAHGVPPVLAAIQIPGKQAAANELPNAIMSFQTLEAGPLQNLIEERLWDTLGDPKLNGGLELPSIDEDSDGPFEFREIIEEMGEAMKILAPVDTLSRAKEQLPEQASKGRDLKDGLKD